ncbi:amino acid adenylation domain-containing protein [Micromonospora peucetia]|uniref:amino acid adenylation domain-containing protein n=1 Tax=Micromonospora peucetia TaxID=47871 RepID=UPI0033166C28
MVEVHHSLTQHPEQTDFWRAEIARNPESTVLTRDWLGQLAEQPESRLQGSLDELARLAADRITRGDSDLHTVLHLAVLAVVAARATDSESVWILADDVRGTLPVSVTVDGAATVRDLLSQVRGTYLKGLQSADVPVQALFDEAGLTPSDLLVSVGTGEDRPERALRLRVDEAGRDLELRYRSDLFTEATVARLLTAYTRIHAALVADVESPLAPLLAADDEETAVLRGFNDTAYEYPSPMPLHRFLERQAAENPDRVALGDDGTSFDGLNRSANRIAHRLVGLSVRPGAVIGVCLPRSAESLTAMYGVLKAGGAYLPIDPTLPPARIAYLIEHSGATTVIGDDASRSLIGAEVSFLHVSDPETKGRPEGNPDVEIGLDDLAYVIYTSGSTGRPKGVMIEHRAIVNRLLWMQRRFPLGPDDVILHKTPISFDVSVWEIFWWSIAGCAVAVLPSGQEKNPELVAERVAAAGATTMHFVPSMLEAFLQYLFATGTQAGLGTLRRVVVSGEALTPLQVSLFGQMLPDAELHNLYGPTEAAVDVSWFDCAGADPRRSVPIGGPIDNIRLHVLTRAGATAAIGTPGELCIAGVGLARGYLNAPELTAERFVEHPGLPGERAYRTGDLARWLPDGTIEYLGRIDNQVKIRGYRIELGEIEHVAQRDAGVLECAVAAVEDGSGDRVLCAYVVAGAGYHEARLLDLLRGQLPPYMVPPFLMLVPEIPTSHNGKRDLRQLPRPERTPADRERVAARTEIEKTLVTIWEEALGVAGVGVTDDFFSLGGDSIKFIRVLAGARAAGLSFSFQDLFAHPVIAELAGVVTTAEAGFGSTGAEPFALLSTADRGRLPAGVVDAYPLSALQEGLMFETLRRAEPGLYHDVATYEVAETIDPAAFRTALAAVVARHPVLRTSFHVDGYSRPLQLVHREVPLPFTVTDLADAGAAEQDAALDRLHESELARGHQPGATDLVRVYVDLLGERGSRYTLSYHAALLDGWSVGTLNRDLFEAYLTVRDGGRPEVAAEPVSYPDFLRLEQAAQESPEQRRFWLEHLDGAEVCRIPTAETPPAREPGVVFHDVPVSTEVSDGIRRLAGQLRVPVKSVLMAAHLVVLALVSGTDDVTTGYEHSGRPEELGGENVVAQFLNTIPFRLPDLTDSWADIIRSVYRTELGLLPYRRYPIADIIRLREGRQTPFEAVFNFTHFHVLKDLSQGRGFDLIRSRISSRTEFPLRAEFWQDALDDGVGLALHYDPQRFHPDQVSRIAGYYGRALEVLVSDADADHQAVSLLSPAELRRLTEELPGRDRDLPDGTVLDVVARIVASTPGEVAVRDGAAQLTYRELDEASGAVASLLHRAGVGRGDVVALAMDRGLIWAVSVLAVLRRGAVYLPLDVSGPSARVAGMVETSGSRYVLTTADPTDPAVSGLSAQIIQVGPDDLGEQSGSQHPDVSVGPDDPAYVIFTSGSTGTPKGALIHHRGMLNHLIAKVDDLELTAADRIAQVAGQTFDISVWQLLAAWLVGGRTVVIGNDAVADPRTFLGRVAEERITVLEVVPSYLDILLTELDARPVELTGLRWTMVTGEALPPRLTERWFARSAVPLVNAYGPTEASDDVTHHFMTAPVVGDRTPVGRAIANTGVYVLRPRGGFAPLGTYGEIWVTGTGVGLGYVNDPDRTAAAFRQNTIDGRSRWMYRTGDVGRWSPAGFLDCAGRDDQQVKVRGHRIELSEIEVALTRLPGIGQAVVVLAGSGARARLVAHLTGPGPVRLDAVRAGLAELLPPQMLPDAVVHRDEFPLTRNGKVDRAALVAETVEEQARNVVQPRGSDRERAVVEAFATVLGVPVSSVGTQDNFFDLGGHSLAAMRVATLLGVGVRDLLGRPTAQLLAERLDEPGGERLVSERDLLVDLAPGDLSGDDAVTLVCVPFAGGGAVSYLPLARALRELDPAIRVLGVDLPARDRDDRRTPVPADQLVAALAAEIGARVRGPVALLGHSAGAALTLATAARLDRLGTSARHLFLVGSVLSTAEPEEISDAGIRDFLARITRLDGLADLPEDGWVDLAAAFRYDAGCSRVLGAALVRTGVVFDRPVTLLLGSDDPVFTGTPDPAAGWRALAPQIQAMQLDGGGHYLNTTRPRELADRIAERVGG